MIVKQLDIFGAELKIGKVEKPSKIAKEIARPFKCVLCEKIYLTVLQSYYLQ